MKLRVDEIKQLIEKGQNQELGWKYTDIFFKRYFFLCINKNYFLNK